MLMPTLFNDRLFDGFFNGFFDSFATPTRPARPEMKGASPFSTMMSAMRTDVTESETGYNLAIELPGFKKEDVKAHLKDGYLTITASTDTNQDEKNEDGKYIRRERHFGSCSRSFYVGDQVSEEDIKARFEDGVLKLALPKKEAIPAVEEKKYIAIEG